VEQDSYRSEHVDLPCFGFCLDYGCKSEERYIEFMDVFRARRFLGWRIFAFRKTAANVQPVFARAVAEYMRKKADNEPVTQPGSETYKDLGTFVYEDTLKRKPQGAALIGDLVLH